MSRQTGSIEHYVDRTVDLAAYHGIQPAGTVRLEHALALPDQGGAIVTGVQKIAQRFLLELLREKDSTLLYPGGTFFLAELRQGRFNVPADLMGAFARAVVEVKRVLQAKESDTDPDDEKFVDAVIQHVEIRPGGAVIRFSLITQAGDAREFIFPLEVSLQGRE